MQHFFVGVFQDNSVDTNGYRSWFMPPKVLWGITLSEMYCNDYVRGTTDRHAEPTIETETLATGKI